MKVLKDYEIKYLNRTKDHIASVNEFASKIDKSYPNHDKDKLNELFDAYSLMMKKDTFGGSNSADNLSGLTKAESDKLNEATFKHITSNKHHPECWTKIKSFDRANPQPSLDCRNMSFEAIDEMLCDWCAMSKEFGNTPQEWMDKTVPSRWVFSQAQTDYMKKMLNKLWG